MEKRYRHFTLEERCRLRALMGLRLRVSECLGYRTPIQAFAVNLGVAFEM